jgi:two-component system nitrogen regulation response regulator GlnG
MVGGSIPIRSNVRIVAATHHDLRQQIRKGLFREDLYYRLNVVPMRMPPLRERAQDIPDLARHFLQRVESEGLGAKTLSGQALARLRAYHWPGNVRELENLIRRVAALYPQDTIGVDVIESELAEPLVNEPDTSLSLQSSEDTLAASVTRHLTDYFDRHEDALPPPGLRERVVNEVERPLIILSLEATKGNQIRAAELLGINRNTLRKRIRELEISVVRGLR